MSDAFGLQGDSVSASLKSGLMLFQFLSLPSIVFAAGFILLFFTNKAEQQFNTGEIICKGFNSFLGFNFCMYFLCVFLGAMTKSYALNLLDSNV